MTPADAARVLAIAVMFDRRTVGESDAIAWADALDGLDPRDCADAVRAHYRDTTTWLMPAHIRDRIGTRDLNAAHARHTASVVREIESAKSKVASRETVEAAKRIVAETVAAKLAEREGGTSA